MSGFPPPNTTYEHFVSYGETDTMGFLYNGEYLHLFERARSKFMRDRDMSYRDVEAKGLLLPVREAHVRYRSPAKYDDRILVRARVSEWGRASIRFDYEIRAAEDERLIATGFTHHPCVNRDMKPIAVPDWLKESCSD
jgi:acyl-CoA thioester hydrolase